MLFSFFRTSTIILILFEYLTNLNIRKVRINLNNLNSLNPEFRIVTDGKIDNKSIIAIGENG